MYYSINTGTNSLAATVQIIFFKQTTGRKIHGYVFTWGIFHSLEANNGVLFKAANSHVEKNFSSPMTVESLTTYNFQVKIYFLPRE